MYAPLWLILECVCVLAYFSTFALLAHFVVVIISTFSNCGAARLLTAGDTTRLSITPIRYQRNCNPRQLDHLQRVSFLKRMNNSFVWLLIN